MAEISQAPHLWDQITARQDHPSSPHQDTKTIYLRWCKDVSIETVFTDLDTLDYPAFGWLGSAHALVQRVMDEVGGTELGRVIITKLKPMGIIGPHSDEGDYADKFERFHVPLCDSSDAFGCDYFPQHTETAFMRAGELWTFNHKRNHFVFNGDTDRIHLIVDAVAPKYRRERYEV